MRSACFDLCCIRPGKSPHQHAQRRSAGPVSRPFHAVCRPARCTIRGQPFDCALPRHARVDATPPAPRLRLFERTGPRESWFARPSNSFHRSSRHDNTRCRRPPLRSPRPSTGTPLSCPLWPAEAMPAPDPPSRLRLTTARIPSSRDASDPSKNYRAHRQRLRSTPTPDLHTHDYRGTYPVLL